MKNDGWTWNDLAGELMARGIDPDEASDFSSYLKHHTPEIAAHEIEKSVERA
jgi:hypothetical protein